MTVFSVSGPWYCQSAVWSGRWGQGDGVQGLYTARQIYPFTFCSQLFGYLKDDFRNYLKR